MSESEKAVIRIQFLGVHPAANKIVCSDSTIRTLSVQDAGRTLESLARMEADFTQRNRGGEILSEEKYEVSSLLMTTGHFNGREYGGTPVQPSNPYWELRHPYRVSRLMPDFLGSKIPKLQFQFGTTQQAGVVQVWNPRR